MQREKRKEKAKNREREKKKGEVEGQKRKEKGGRSPRLLYEDRWRLLLSHYITRQ